MRINKIIISLGLSTVLTGCASVGSIAGSILSSPSLSGVGMSKFKIENGTHYKVGNKYYIGGTAYYPKENYNYIEDGIASWYGPNFNAKPTANGGVFDMRRITAAHRTLPIPSVVRVTNLENGRTIVVKITDRGPYAKDRIIDLSHATAKKLGVISRGTSLVRVQIMANESKQLKMAMKIGRGEPLLNQQLTKVNLKKMRSKNKNNGILSGAYVQAGAYSSYDNAIKVANKIKDLGTTKLYKFNNNGTIIYTVRVGPLKNSNDIKPILTEIIERGFDAIVKVL